MLGNLFDNDDELAIAALTGTGFSSQGVGPPRPRSETKLAGIANQGATCYLNSLLQTLLLTPEFREALFQLPERELGYLEERGEKGSKVRVIPLQLQRLFARLLLLDQQSVSTEELTESFGWTNNEQFQQQDVQEMNRILFSAIEDSLAGTSGHNLIKQLYHGNIVNQIICEECGKVSEREEDFLDLTLSISGVNSLESCLSSSYCDMELMDGKNQYRCDMCQKLVNAKKGAKIRNLPQILTISLLRFSYDFQQMKRFKETGKFTFPMVLNMTPYVEKVSSEEEEFELFSVVIHRGGAYGGHYFAYIRDIDNLGHWVNPGKVDVEVISKKKSGEVELIKTNSPSELIQIILEKIPSHALPIDQLGNEINKQTGVTWNKRFKKHYGTLTKFLSKCEGDIVYNPHTRWVYLADALPTETHISPLDETDPVDTDTAENETTSTDDGHDHRKPKMTTTPDPPPEGFQWFNFDDSRVSPIHQSEIERHFQGRDSAYMLFYRRKQAPRPSDAFQYPVYAMPDGLLTTVLSENEAIFRQRQEYEARINMVTVQLHFGEDYHYKDGALKVFHAGRSFTELTIDRRKRIADLLEMVKEVMGSRVPDPLTLHRVQEVPSGLHLYDCVSEDKEASLISENIDSNTKLFVWDGQQVNNSSIPVGFESEPIYLTIIYGNPSQFSSGYPKNITLGEFRSSICALTDISDSNLRLDKLVGADNCQLKSLCNDDATLPLAVLGFQDGDTIVASDKTLKSDPVVETYIAASSQLNILVENRCIELQSRWSKQIQVTKDMTIGELKVMAISAFCGVDILDGGRLRVDHSSLGLRPPLHEQQTVAEADLNNSTVVVLEPGKAPLTNEMTLTFTPHDPAGDNPDLEVTVEKNSSVKTCLQKMLRKAGLEGDDWHLRKTNWCGEAADVLDDLDLDLDRSLVHDGDHLLLLPGSLPPKGFIRLPISLYPTPDNPRHTSPDQKGMIAWITSGIQALMSKSGPDAVNTLEPIQIGEVEISKDATLEDLKLQVMTLPSVQDMPIPTFDFLRLRLIENHRLTTVLKGAKGVTLRRLKVTAGSQIGVQILPLEENLTVNDIVLNIQQRLPGSLSYSPEQEFIWDISRGATPGELRQCIADFFVLPVEQIVVAKHFPRQFRWMIIEDPKPQMSNQKGKKKKGGVKQSMKQAPYNIQDGDVIGVKTIQGDPDNHDDFSTEEDVRGREEAQRVAEEKKKMREERRKEYGDGPIGKHKPEVALTIKVDTFT